MPVSVVPQWVMPLVMYAGRFFTHFEFYGKITFLVKNGRVVNVEMDQTIKPD